MVGIKIKWRGSFTVEGTIVVSITCIIIGMVIMFGMYGHDRSVMQSVANQMAQDAVLWSGRYVVPEMNEVDYVALKENQSVDLIRIKNQGYRRIQSRLLCGELKDIQVKDGILGKEIQIKIIVAFHIGKYQFTSEAQASGKVIESKDLPRKKMETGEGE